MQNLQSVEFESFLKRHSGSTDCACDWVTTTVEVFLSFSTLDPRDKNNNQKYCLKRRIIMLTKTKKLWIKYASAGGAREKSKIHVMKLIVISFLVTCRASNFKMVLVRWKIYRPRVNLNREHWNSTLIEKPKLLSSSFRGILEGNSQIVPGKVANYPKWRE